MHLSRLVQFPEGFPSRRAVKPFAWKHEDGAGAGTARAAGITKAGHRTDGSRSADGAFYG